LLILKARIFDSRVEAARSRLAAAPNDPATWPPASASAASIKDFSSARAFLKVVQWNFSSQRTRSLPGFRLAADIFNRLSKSRGQAMNKIL
jgi:hypothetical protein